MTKVFSAKEIRKLFAYVDRYYTWETRYDSQESYAFFNDENKTRVYISKDRKYFVYCSIRKNNNIITFKLKSYKDLKNFKNAILILG